jgi:hypothetical protein
MKLSLILGFAALASASFWNPYPKPTKTPSYSYTATVIATPGTPYPTPTPSGGKPHTPKPTPKAPHKKCVKICASKPLKTCGEGYVSFSLRRSQVEGSVLTACTRLPNCSVTAIPAVSRLAVTRRRGIWGAQWIMWLCETYAPQLVVRLYCGDAGVSMFCACRTNTLIFLCSGEAGAVTFPP